MIIFTKFHTDWIKIVDFLVLAKFCACLLFFAHPLHTYVLQFNDPLVEQVHPRLEFK